MVLVPFSTLGPYQNNQNTGIAVCCYKFVHTMSFGGAIRPLPGQPGYGMRESDKLAQETREMQINLMKIQEQMKRVQTKGDQAIEEGGAGRWRSARSDRGSLRRYNKDIKSGTVRRNTSKRGGPREMVRATISQSPH